MIGNRIIMELKSILSDKQILLVYESSRHTQITYFFSKIASVYASTEKLPKYKILKVFMSCLCAYMEKNWQERIL